MKKLKSTIKLYKLLLIEIIETLCTICLYLEHDGRYSHNPMTTHMRSHFESLKHFSEFLREAPHRRER